MVFINPHITELTQELQSYEEGCLSVPGFHEKVERPAHIQVQALDRNGKPFEMKAEGLLAVCLQHELDHRSEEHTSELQSLMRISYAVFCLKKKKKSKYD